MTATRDVLYAGSVPSAATLLYVLAAAALALAGGSALFRRADLAMYEGKRLGGNIVCVAAGESYRTVAS